MLITYSFSELAILIESLYFVDPDPYEGQEGPERGVRVEVRRIRPQPYRGSVYASQQIVIDDAYLRIDLLESVDAGPHSRDRMHVHVGMRDNEPGDRVFEPSLSDDPLPWVSAKLNDLAGVLTDAGLDDLEPFADDIAVIEQEHPMIMASIDALLTKVRAGSLAQGPKADSFS